MRAALEDEVDLGVARAPPADGDALGRGGVEQVGADGGFDEAAPGLGGRARIEATAELAGDEAGVVDLELGARAARTDDLARVLLKAGDEAGAGEELEVMGERRRIAGVVELPEHLRVRELLG